MVAARIEMKLGTYVYYIISMTITCFHDGHVLFEKASGNIFFKLLLHSSNLLTVAHMEVKLGAHVYYIVSMTTIGIFLYYLFYRGLAPFHRDIHIIIVVYKMSGDNASKLKILRI